MIPPPPPETGRPLTPVGSAPGDPFRDLAEVVFRQTFEGGLLGGLEILTSDGRAAGRFVRDGVGLRVVMMNWALQDSAGRPLLLVRMDPPPRGIGILNRWTLQAPDGGPLGTITRRTRLTSTYTLAFPAQTDVVAAVRPLGWRPFAVARGTSNIATVSFSDAYFPTPWHPGGIEIQFAPGSDADLRKFIVALIGFVAQFNRPRQWPLAASPG